MKVAFVQAMSAAVDASPEADSQRVQAAQDKQAATARDAAQEQDQEKIDSAAAAFAAQSPDPNAGPLWFLVGDGDGVAHRDDEIRLRCNRKQGPTAEQLAHVIELAQKKGWKTLYVYDGNGKPDLEMAAILNAKIKDMGLEGQICCCDKGENMQPDIKTMKRMLHGAASSGMAAVAAAAVATLAARFAPEI